MDRWASWKDDRRYLHNPTDAEAGGYCIYTGGLLYADGQTVQVQMHGTRRGHIPRSDCQAAHGDALPRCCRKVKRQKQPASREVHVYVKGTVSSCFLHYAV